MVTNPAQSIKSINQSNFIT
uniref:Uncharacterized protein n=1 Tax=Anguilla anguilla TaxID=7936 RepID=A0A0E9REN3_ANGAN